MNAAIKRASALRRMMSMKVAAHNAAGANTEVVAHSKNRKSPNQLVGRPNGTVSSGQTATTRTTMLATNVCVGVTMSCTAGFGLRSRFGKNDAMDFTVRVVPPNDPSSATRDLRALEDLNVLGVRPTQPALAAAHG